MDIEDLRRRLMLSISGALAVGCGPSVEPSVEDGTASGGVVGSGSATTGPGASSGATTAAATEAEADETAQPTYDVGDRPDVPPFIPPEGCPPQPEPPAEECTAELPYLHAYFLFYCDDVPEGGSCETWVEDVQEDASAIQACLGGMECSGPQVLAIGCGPLPDSGEQCCAWLIAREGFCPGRPFVVAGRERLAELCERDDWSALVATPMEPSSPERVAIAAAWAEQALFEHASIASFSRFILQLLACGAPAHVVRDAQVALGEEIEHARLFFGFASHYAGQTIGPTALATHDALAASDDFDEVVLATVREGCIAETISAWHVALAARSARDPSMAGALSRVAEQELEHAALAWRVLAWALPHASASLRRRVEATLGDAVRFAPRGPTLTTAISAAQWLAHGVLPADERAAATGHALRELVAPIARSLLAQPAPARAPAPMLGPSA